MSTADLPLDFSPEIDRICTSLADAARGAARALDALQGRIDTLELRVTDLETPDTPDVPPDTPPDVPPPPPDRGLLLGANLAPVEDWSTERPFTNLCRTMRPWVGAGYGRWTGPLTPDGYPAALGAGEIVQGLMLWDTPHRPTGAHVLTWEGDGEVQLAHNGCAQNVRGDATARRITFDLVPGPESGGLRVIISRTNPANPVRGLRVERTPPVPNGGSFDPVFLQRLTPYRVLRCMDWSRTNDTVRPAWSNRRPAGYATEANLYGPKSQGVAWETIIDLANATGSDPWICLPYGADSAATRDYYRQLGALFAERLAPKRSVYVEYGNELWNSMFPASVDLARRGDVLRTLAADLPLAWDAFNETFPRNRARRVLAYHLHQVWAMGWLAGAQVPGEGVPRDAYDLLAPAGYFNYGDYATIDSILQGCAESLRGDILPKLRQHADIARALNKPLALYEAGPHHVTALPTVLDVVAAAHRDPRMGDLVRELRAACAADYRGRPLVDGPLCWYYSCGKPWWSGVWGLLEYQDQPLADAPKYRAATEVTAPV